MMLHDQNCRYGLRDLSWGYNYLRIQLEMIVPPWPRNYVSHHAFSSHSIRVNRNSDSMPTFGIHTLPPTLICQRQKWYTRVYLFLPGMMNTYWMEVGASTRMMSLLLWHEHDWQTGYRHCVMITILRRESLIGLYITKQSKIWTRWRRKQKK